MNTQTTLNTKTPSVLAIIQENYFHDSILSQMKPNEVQAKWSRKKTKPNEAESSPSQMKPNW